MTEDSTETFLTVTLAHQRSQNQLVTRWWRSELYMTSVSDLTAWKNHITQVCKHQRKREKGQTLRSTRQCKVHVWTGQ